MTISKKALRLAAATAIIGFASVAVSTTASADWRRDHDHDRDHHRHYHHGPEVVVRPQPYYAPPPVVYAPPPTYYEAPPPIVGFGLNIHLR